jgi:heme A synthase
MGGITGLLIVATLVGWARAAHDRARAVATALAVLLLLGLQVLLGAAVVKLELPPMLVLVHLGMAQVLFALLIILAVGITGAQTPGRQGSGTVSRTVVRLVIGAVAAVFILILTGAYVRATGSSWACAGFPACNGVWLPFGVSRAIDVHLLHRLVAIAVAVHLALTVLRVWRSARHIRVLPVAAGVLALALVFQLAVGITAVSTSVPPLAQVLHVAGATAVWGAVVTLGALTWRYRSTGVPS